MLASYRRTDNQGGSWRTRLWRGAIFSSLVALLSAVALAVGPSGTALADPGDPGGLNTGQGDNGDPPLTFFTGLTLPTIAGDIRAVVYDGNDYLNFSTSTVNMTGFGVVPAGAIAKSTYVVVDGQCGPGVVPEPCIGGRPTGGTDDRLSFTGGAGTINKGPDAWRGHDGCGWAPTGDTCLWDTRTEDVSTAVAPGDTAVTATVTAGPQGDCLNHETQVFAVGPAAAWAFGGYQAAGVGLRNRDRGQIALAGIPPGATIARALLYWNELAPSPPSNRIRLNGQMFFGTGIGRDTDPCWTDVNNADAQASWAFRADVTSVVAPLGNGVYLVDGYPTGGDGMGLQIGRNPWDFFSRFPMAEGASLIVFYSGQTTSTPGKVTGGGYIDPVTGQLVGEATLLINSGPSMGNKANFGFVMSFREGDDSPSGNLLYDDKALSERIKATSIDQIIIGDGICGRNTHFDARITAEENGTPGQEFHVFGDDCDEPGSSPGAGPDTFGIHKIPAGYGAAGPLVGGNIQIHKS